jgi:two-component system sensor histidine kinase DegS
MLNYGLQAGIQELADDLIQRIGERPEIQVTLPPSEARYPPRVEEHLFRITQQACENALQHAEAEFLFIEGRLEPETVTLSVMDDGVGFDAGDKLNLNQLLADHHYGIAGMIERAALIGAQVKVASKSGQGTRVYISWEQDGQVEQKTSFDR